MIAIVTINSNNYVIPSNPLKQKFHWEIFTKERKLILLLFLSVILIILSVVSFVLAYAYLNDKAEEVIMWSFSGNLQEKIIDKGKYKKQQGKFMFYLGLIFVFVPISIYAVLNSNLDEQILYLWIVVLAIVAFSNIIQVRKNMR